MISSSLNRKELPVKRYGPALTALTSGLQHSLKSAATLASEMDKGVLGGYTSSIDEQILPFWMKTKTSGIAIMDAMISLENITNVLIARARSYTETC